jgi:hypothetical protein
MSSPQSHQLTVSIASDALNTLMSAGASLYALPAFQSSNLTGRPLVTYANRQLSQSQTVSWTEDYQAFVSRISMTAGITDPSQRTITVGANASVRLGDAMTVQSPLQCGVTADGSAGSVAIRSEVADLLSCGLCYGDMPACAMTLIRGLQVTIAPIQSLFLMFSTSDFAPGAWVEQSSGDGLLVDMANTPARTVTFDLTAPKPWLESDQVWATAVPAGTDLAGLLKLKPPRNVPRRA